MALLSVSCKEEERPASEVQNPSRTPAVAEEPPRTPPETPPPATAEKASRFIAIIDSGIDPTHALFTDAFIPAESLTLPESLPEAFHPAPGDRLLGWDLVDQSSRPVDRTGHGTHVAGIIARELAFTGNEPAFHLLALRTGDKRHGLKHLTAAISLLNGLKQEEWEFPLVCLPIEYYPKPHEEKQFIAFRVALSELLDGRTLVVCAAGNRGQNNDDPSGRLHCYPSDFPFEGVLSVACCNRSGHLHPLSNFGAQSVDLAAPGFGVEGPGLGGELHRETGSSQSAAFVTAQAARLWTRSPHDSAETIKDRLLAEVKIHPSLIGKCVSNGFLPSVPPAESESKDLGRP